jgi:hypothetical protein
MRYEDIKDFQQRCEEHQDHQSGMITSQMLEDRLQEEIDELRAYIEAKQEQGEPLCTAAMFDDAFLAKSGLSPDTKLYTTPQQSKPLTDAQITALLVELCVPQGYEGVTETFTAVVRAIEAAHGIKENT